MESLAAEPERFGFHQAVRLLEAQRPDAVPVGDGHDWNAEAVRFRGRLERSFPAADLTALTPAKGPAPPTLTVAFMGLAGAFGPLPAPLAELILERARRGDEGARDFLDIFHHRLLSILARAKRAHTPVLQGGRNWRNAGDESARGPRGRGRPEDSAFADYLWALLGLLTPGLRTSLGRKPHARMGGQERSLLALAGLLNQWPVSLHAVERVMETHFGLKVRGVPLVGRWIPLAADQRTSLGRFGTNNALGQGAVLGGKVWDQSAAIRLDLGPMALSRMRAFLPGGDAHRAARTLLGFMLGGSVEVDMALHLPPREVPGTRLSADPAKAAALGWTSFVTTRLRRRPGLATLRLGALGG